MNQDYLNNGNCEPGFDDAGTRIKGGTRRLPDEERIWRLSMKDWPGSLQEAEAQMNIIRQNPKAYNFENTTGNNEIA